MFETFWWTWSGSNRRPLPCHLRNINHLQAIPPETKNLERGLVDAGGRHKAAFRASGLHPDSRKPHRELARNVLSRAIAGRSNRGYLKPSQSGRRHHELLDQRFPHRTAGAATHIAPSMRSTFPCGVSTPSYATEPTTMSDMLREDSSSHVGHALACLPRARPLSVQAPAQSPASRLLNARPEV